MYLAGVVAEFDIPVRDLFVIGRVGASGEQSEG